MVKSTPIVAIIDPDNSIYNHLVQLLDGIGVKVNTCSSAETFLARLASHRYACIISETCLPGIGGVELLKELSLRQDPIPTILLTKRPDVSLAVHAMQAGAIDFIEKPFTEVLLLDLIKQVVSEDARLP